METKVEIEVLEDLSKAVAGSFYTICGAGGDLAEWVKGYNGLLESETIGVPETWYRTTGKAINAYAHPRNPRDAFPDDLTVLLFPLDGLDVGRLAMVKLAQGDRWFDDITGNMAPDSDDEGE